MKQLADKMEGLRKGEFARMNAIDHDIDKINAWNNAIDECIALAEAEAAVVREEIAEAYKKGFIDGGLSK